MQQFVSSEVVYIRRTNETKGLTEIAYYDGSIQFVNHAPDQLLNHTLMIVNSNLTASLQSVKTNLKFVQYTPIIIDAPRNFVFFPLYKRESYEKLYINNQHYLQSIDAEETTIYFTNGRTLIVEEKSSQIMKHYNRALIATDYYSKMRKRFL